jgi:dTDP-4-amino-4,6-dideoxy-D-galactose acyltransferase
MNSEPVCQYLEWDSAFFGYKIARVSGGRWDQEGIASALDWCATHAIDCLYFLADADDTLSTALAEENRFHLVDVRITFELRSFDVLPDITTLRRDIRLCAPDDISALRAIAKHSHRASRFYYDPHFSKALCDLLYETWIEQSCMDDAHTVLVAEDEGQPIGYTSCYFDKQHSGHIGLVGVAAAARGRGIGLALLVESLRWLAAHGAHRASVVTQVRNIQAQRLYQRCGFLTRSVQLWYHRWFAYDEGQVTR